MVLVSTPGHCQSLDSPGKRAQEPVPNSHPKIPHTVSPGHPQLQFSRPSYSQQGEQKGPSPTCGRPSCECGVFATQAWGGSMLKVFGEALLTHRHKWRCTQSGLPTSLTQP